MFPSPIDNRRQRFEQYLTDPRIKFYEDAMKEIRLYSFPQQIIFLDTGDIKCIPDPQIEAILAKWEKALDEYKQSCYPDLFTPQ